LLTLCLLAAFTLSAAAQGNPNFNVSDHHMIAGGTLDVTTQSTVGVPKPIAPASLGQLLELDYGVTGRWTSSFYLEGAAQQGSIVFTGFRLENRLRPLRGEHWINPALAFEFANLNEATRTDLDLVGSADLTTASLGTQHRETKRKALGKLILSSGLGPWDVAENLTAEKNLDGANGVNFGYALGVHRPLATGPSSAACTFCRHSLSAGAEFFGELGSTERFGLVNTAHYLAPSLAWRVKGSSTLKFSPAFGLTQKSDRLLVRLSYDFAVEGFGRKLARSLGR
jgi:hypothetical protein